MQLCDPGRGVERSTCIRSEPGQARAGLETALEEMTCAGRGPAARAVCLPAVWPGLPGVRVQRQVAAEPTSVGGCPCRGGRRVGEQDWFLRPQAAADFLSCLLPALLTALLYKPIDRVTRSTLVLHVSLSPCTAGTGQDPRETEPRGEVLESLRTAHLGSWAEGPWTPACCLACGNHVNRARACI